MAFALGLFATSDMMFINLSATKLGVNSLSLGTDAWKGFDSAVSVVPG